jgi:hypothetical protein
LPVQVWSAFDRLATVTLVPHPMFTVWGENCQLTPELMMVSAAVLPETAQAVAAVCVGFGVGFAVVFLGAGVTVCALAGVEALLWPALDVAAVWLRADVARCVVCTSVGVPLLTAPGDAVSKGEDVGPPLIAGDPLPHAVASSATPRAATDVPRLRMCQDTYVDGRGVQRWRRFRPASRGRPGWVGATEAAMRGVRGVPA